jgi:hypothetical protein
MLVDVVRMRADGEKLAPDRIKDAPSVRGRLIVKMQPWSAKPSAEKVPTTFAYLVDHMVERHVSLPLIPFLREARLRDMDGSFVIVGIEKPSVEFNAPEFPQAWWCRPVQ